jgi:hypothetical protein
VVVATRTAGQRAGAARAAPTELYRPPRWWERLAALVGLPAIGIVLGVIAATAVAGVLIFLFTTLSGRLT